MIIRINLVGSADLQHKFFKENKFDFRSLEWKSKNCFDIEYSVIEEESSEFDELRNLIDSKKIKANIISKDFVDMITNKNISSISQKYYNFITNDGSLFRDYISAKYYHGELLEKLKYLLSSSVWNRISNISEDFVLNVNIFLKKDRYILPENFDEYISFFYNEKHLDRLLIDKDWMYVMDSDSFIEIFKRNNILEFYTLNTRMDSSMRIINDSVINDLLINQFNEARIL